MKQRIIILICMGMALWGICPTAGAQKKVSASVLERLDKIQSELSPVYRFMFNEHFPSTGIRITAAGEMRVDYSASASDRSMYEVELNHYLSQLGVGHISLPDAGEYESEDVELMGVFSVNCLHPAVSIGEYAQALTAAAAPFKPSSEVEMQTDNVNLFDFAAMLGSLVTEVEGEKFEWLYVKGGFNFRLTLQDKGSGFTVSLNGINRLEEYEY